MVAPADVTRRMTSSGIPPGGGTGERSGERTPDLGHAVTWMRARARARADNIGNAVIVNRVPDYRRRSSIGQLKHM